MAFNEATVEQLSDDDLLISFSAASYNYSDGDPMPARKYKEHVVAAESISMREWRKIRLAKHTPEEVLATARTATAEFLYRVENP
jgi:hypothetical protein